MAEYSKEKLYFVKLPKDFFQDYKLRALEGIPGGKDYELIYLKLICESVSHNGYLRFDEATPYTAEMIAGITNSPIDTVRVGLNVLQQFGLIKINNNDTIFIPEVPEMTVSQTVSALKKQEQIKRRNEAGVDTGVEKIPPSFHQRELRELESKRESRDLENKEDSPSLHSEESKNPTTGREGRLGGTEVEDELF